jgi:hypothetical protein
MQKSVTIVFAWPTCLSSGTNPSGPVPAIRAVPRGQLAGRAGGDCSAGTSPGEGWRVGASPVDGEGSRGEGWRVGVSVVGGEGAGGDVCPLGSRQGGGEGVGGDEGSVGASPRGVLLFAFGAGSVGASVRGGLGGADVPGALARRSVSWVVGSAGASAGSTVAGSAGSPSDPPGTGSAGAAATHASPRRVSPGPHVDSSEDGAALQPPSSAMTPISTATRAARDDGTNEEITRRPFGQGPAARQAAYAAAVAGSSWPSRPMRERTDMHST